MTKVIIGLGNPGADSTDEKFEWTRHNIGYMALEALAARLGAAFAHDQGLVAQAVEVQTACGLLVLVKPLTGMNDSGKTAAVLVSRYSLPLSDLLVIQDDVSLKTGRFRFQASSSHGGHNGIRSLIAELGGNQFPRLKVGLGLVPSGSDILEFVLTPLPVGERADMLAIRDVAVDAATTWFEKGLQPAMCAFNGINLFPQAS